MHAAALWTRLPAGAACVAVLHDPFWHAVYVLAQGLIPAHTLYHMLPLGTWTSPCHIDLSYWVYLWLFGFNQQQQQQQQQRQQQQKQPRIPAVSTAAVLPEQQMVVMAAGVFLSMHALIAWYPSQRVASQARGCSNVLTMAGSLMGKEAAKPSPR
jgi:hypothetical protein